MTNPQLLALFDLPSVPEPDPRLYVMAEDEIAEVAEDDSEFLDGLEPQCGLVGQVVRRVHDPALGEVVTLRLLTGGDVVCRAAQLREAEYVGRVEFWQLTAAERVAIVVCRGCENVTSPNRCTDCGEDAGCSDCAGECRVCRESLCDDCWGEGGGKCETCDEPEDEK